MKDSQHIKAITRGYMNACICGGKTATVMFKAYVKTLGRIKIEAKAESSPKNNCPSFVTFDGSTYIDIVRRKLLVEVSDGLKMSKDLCVNARLFQCYCAFWIVLKMGRLIKMA